MEDPVYVLLRKYNGTWTVVLESRSYLGAKMACIERRRTDRSGCVYHLTMRHLLPMSDDRVGYSL